MLWASGKTRNGSLEARVCCPYGLRPRTPSEPYRRRFERARELAGRSSRYRHRPGCDEQLRSVRNRPHGEPRSIGHLRPRPVHDSTGRPILVLTALGEHHESVPAELHRPDRREHLRRLGRREPSEPEPTDNRRYHRELGPHVECDCGRERLRLFHQPGSRRGPLPVPVLYDDHRQCRAMREPALRRPDGRRRGPERGDELHLVHAKRRPQHAR